MEVFQDKKEEMMFFRRFQSCQGPFADSEFIRSGNSALVRKSPPDLIRSLNNCKNSEGAAFLFSGKAPLCVPFGTCDAKTFPRSTQ